MQCINGTLNLIVSIPQAVSAVATNSDMSDESILNYVSIPQAVSAVATYLWRYIMEFIFFVSIPQAVSAVATCKRLHL